MDPPERGLKSRDMKHELTYKQLEKIGTHCGKQNWNSYGAMQIDQPVLLEAKRFLDLLDSEIESPFPTPEDDGGICMGWEKGQDWLAVTVTPAGCLKWEWEIGGENGENGRPFGEKLPEALLDWLCFWRVKKCSKGGA